MIEAAGFERVTFTPTDRRHGGAAFGLALVIAAVSPSACACRAPASCSRAKACWRSIDTRPLPLPAKIAVAAARLIERPSSAEGAGRLAAALTRLGPSYVKLGQFLATRPDVVGTAIARDLESAAGQDAAVSAGAGRGGGRRRARQAARRRFSRASARRSPPPRSRRCTAPRSSRTARASRSRSRCCGPASSAASAPISPPSSLSRARRRASSLEAQRLRLIEVVETLARSVAIEMDLRLEAAALSEMAREHARGQRLPRAHGRLGPHRARRADARMDRRHHAQRSRRARGTTASICRRSAAA